MKKVRKKIEAELTGKKLHTVFRSSIILIYILSNLEHDHYMLGTTGGGSDLRGEEFGEFDHITWVTFKCRGRTKNHKS